MEYRFDKREFCTDSNSFGIRETGLKIKKAREF